MEGVSSRELTKLVDTRELWFILIANPDGYDFTFTPENRLWRKNLRDNDDDGQITAIDGVDPNRNFPTRWSYDDEGSNREPPSETYHGTGPASEPETKAFLSLMDRVHFTSTRTTTRSAQLMLWPFRLAGGHAPADEPIMTALAGDDENPAIEAFDPDVGAELYTTNGDTNDHMYKSTAHDLVHARGQPGRRPPAAASAFQDSRPTCRRSSRSHVQFALDLARSADDPSRPESHLGNKVAELRLDDFKVSFGNPQTVQVNARRDLGKITLRYRVNGGRTQTKSTNEWTGRPPLRRRGRLLVPPHARAGHRNEARGHREGLVHLDEAHKKSDSFTYKVRSDSNADVLVLAVEDYSGNSDLPAYDRQDEAELPLATTRRRSMRTTPSSTCTTTTRRAARRRMRSASEPLRRRDLVHGQRQRHARRANAGRGGPRGAPHDHRGA